MIAWLALLLGIVLQLWLKDHHVSWTLFFYAMPKPCLIGLAFALAIISRRVRWQQMIAMTVMISLTIWWIMTSHSLVRQNPPPVGKAKDEVTLLYWNLCRPNGLDQEAVDLVREFQPHIAAFVEPGREAGSLTASYEALLPGFKAAWMPRGILWLSRVPSRYRERGKLEGLGAYARFDVDGLGATFPVVVADVHPGLFHSREQQIREVFAQSKDRPDAILVGDFNTPLESHFFDEPRQKFVNALDVKGSGFRETWPVGLPLLSIDHAWIGQGWEVIGTQKIWRLKGSDHAAILVRLRRR